MLRSYLGINTIPISEPPQDDSTQTKIRGETETGAA